MARDLILGESSRGWARGTCGDDPVLAWTPSAVRGELNRTRNLLDITNREVSQAAADGKVTPSEWQSWSEAYKTGHKFTTTASSFWGQNVAVARTHSAEASKWRELVRRRGGRQSAPADANQPPKMNLEKLLLLGIGGAASLALIVKVARK